MAKFNSPVIEKMLTKWRSQHSFGCSERGP